MQQNFSQQLQRTQQMCSSAANLVQQIGQELQQLQQLSASSYASYQSPQASAQYGQQYGQQAHRATAGGGSGVVSAAMRADQFSDGGAARAQGAMAPMGSSRPTQTFGAQEQGNAGYGAANSGYGSASLSSGYGSASMSSGYGSGHGSSSAGVQAVMNADRGAMFSM